MKTNRARKEDLVEEFRDAYADAIAAAEKAAETTATDGWQQMYVAFMDANKDGRGRSAQDIEQLADALKTGPLDGESLKALKAAVKDAQDLCESAAQFDLSTVVPIRGTVEACHRLIADFEERAEAASRSTPLTDGDIAQRMGEAILHVQKVTWNSAVGFIRVVEGK